MKKARQSSIYSKKEELDDLTSDGSSKISL